MTDPKPISQFVAAPAAGAAADWERQRAEEREAHVQRVRASLPSHLLACGVGDVHAEAIVTGLRETAAARACRSWWEGSETFLLLTGGVGSGKTVAACELFAKLMRPGGYEFIGGVPEYDRRAGRVVQACELAALGMFGPEAKEALAQATDLRLLVLDDLGSEYLTDAWRSNLFLLVNARWLKRRRTVITTNLDMAALKARYEPRVFDRIRDSGRAVHCGDKSLRGQP